MTTLELRDHAQQILVAGAKDLTTSQTREAQVEKSRGRAVPHQDAPETAAQTHAILRARSGFDINQLVAEYRALRATVIRLWSDTHPLDSLMVEDVVRFNEAIDQAVGESVSHFHQDVERARNLLIGMLGHDMRTPLSSIVVTASYLAALNAGEQVSVAAQRLIRSGKSIQTLLDDLVDFNRTSLGLGLKVVPSSIDLAAELAEELEQLRSAYPGRPIELEVKGDTAGHWDGGRLKQVLRNLVSNALHSGAPGTPVSVSLAGEDAAVRPAVTNHGNGNTPVSESGIFDPLQRGHAAIPDSDPKSHLGLGLFIVREIVHRHGGDVEMSAAGGRTTFSVRLPRQIRHDVAEERA